MNQNWERIRAFVSAMEHATATHVEPWERGVAFFNTDYPIKYAFNFLRCDDPMGASAAELIDAADRIQGGGGLAHRRVNGFEGMDALAAGFKGAGWSASRLTFMVHDGDLRPRGTAAVEEVDLDEFIPAMVRWDITEDNNAPEVAEQLAASRRALLAAADVTFLVSRIEGEIAGWCEVYVRDSVVQVENVMTFSTFRNRGIASSLVNEGLRLGYSKGAGLGFLIADDEDWPKELYSKLGFSQAGLMWEYTLAH